MGSTSNTSFWHRRLKCAGVGSHGSHRGYFTLKRSCVECQFRHRCFKAGIGARIWMMWYITLGTDREEGLR